MLTLIFLTSNVDELPSFTSFNISNGTLFEFMYTNPLATRNINVNTKLTVSLEDYESELNKVLVGSEKINPQGVPYMVVGIKEETGRYNVLFKDGTNVLTIGVYVV